MDPAIYDDPRKFEAHMAMMQLWASAEWEVMKRQIKRRLNEEFWARHGRQGWLFQSCRRGAPSPGTGRY